MAKAIIRGAHFRECVRLYTRHGTPQPFTHIICDGVSGQAALNAIDSGASGLFVFGHPTLGDWSNIPELAKSPEGNLIHTFLGGPSTPPDPMTVSEFQGLNSIEILVSGHVEKYINGFRNSGGRYVGIQYTGSTLIDNILPAYIVWQTGESFAAVDSDYKIPGTNSPHVDPDQIPETNIIPV